MNDRNVELGRQWRALGPEEKALYVERAKNDMSVFDDTARRKRQLKITEKHVEWNES